MRISVISNSYPHPRFPQSGSFVYNLTDAWAKSGDHVDVYALCSRTHFLSKRQRKRTKLDLNPSINIQYIRYVSFGRKKFFGMDSAEVGFTLSHAALRSAFQKNFHVDSEEFNLYGKFLLSGGRHAAKLSQIYRCKAFADLGESRLIAGFSQRELDNAKWIVQSLKGVVCVSPRLEHEALELGMDQSKVLMSPNVPNTDIFYPLDAQFCRYKLGLPVNKKIVIFVGHFIHRKGPDRVLAAVESLSDDFNCIFIGDGPISLYSQRILAMAQVRNSDLNFWLNAADVFCLPTFAEGSCNAINEARVVGLPIVTSNIEDITNSPFSSDYICVNPSSVPEIAEAIEYASSLGRIQYPGTPVGMKERAEGIRAWMMGL